MQHIHIQLSIQEDPSPGERRKMRLWRQRNAACVAFCLVAAVVAVVAFACTWVVTFAIAVVAFAIALAMLVFRLDNPPVKSPSSYTPTSYGA